MNIPGFTAEFSLYKTDELYRILRVQRSTESVPQHAITAQFIPRFPVDCDFIECYQQGGHFVCYCS
jgi:hypothetical protein